MKNFDSSPLTLRRGLPAALSALVIAIFFSTSCQRQPATDWPGLKRMIRERFPEVRQVSVQQLSEWLAQSEANKPLLLDARALEEYAVSHLPDAYPAANEEQALDVLKNTPEDRSIVIYRHLLLGRLPVIFARPAIATVWLYERFQP